MELTKVNTEVAKVRLVALTDLRNQHFRVNTQLISLEHDWCSMGIICAHIVALVTLHFLKPYPDIGLNIFEQMP